jgi:hypothetical protein
MYIYMLCFIDENIPGIHTHTCIYLHVYILCIFCIYMIHICTYIYMLYFISQLLGIFLC